MFTDIISISSFQTAEFYLLIFLSTILCIILQLLRNFVFRLNSSILLIIFSMTPNNSLQLWSVSLIKLVLHSRPISLCSVYSQRIVMSWFKWRSQTLCLHFPHPEVLNRWLSCQIRINFLMAHYFRPWITGYIKLCHYCHSLEPFIPLAISAACAAMRDAMTPSFTSSMLGILRCSDAVT